MRSTLEISIPEGSLPARGPSSPVLKHDPVLQGLRDDVARAAEEQRRILKNLVEVQGEAIDKQFTALLQRIDQLNQIHPDKLPDNEVTVRPTTPHRRSPAMIQAIQVSQSSDNPVIVGPSRMSTKSSTKSPPREGAAAPAAVPPSRFSYRTGSASTLVGRWRTMFPEMSWSHTHRPDGRRAGSMSSSAAEVLRQGFGRKTRFFCGPFLDIAAAFMEWISELMEPERNGGLAKFVRSKPVEFITAAVIVSNALWVGYTTNYEMTHLDERPTMYILATECFFVGFYSLEIFLKVLVHRGFFLINGEGRWNAFDLIIVLLSYLDLFSTFLAWHAGSYTNMAFVRMLRIFKMVKVIRTLRALRLFRELRLLMDCVLGSFIQLFWCLVLVVTVVYMFSLVFMQGMVDFLLHAKAEGRYVDSETRGRINEEFGTVLTAGVTLFQSITGGVDWNLEYDLVLLTGWVRGVIFIFFIAFFVVTVWNIIMSIFVEEALSLAKPDLDSLMWEKRRQDANDAEALEALFARMKFETHDRITAAEWEGCLTDEVFVSFLEKKGVHIRDARAFFTMMMQHSDEFEDQTVDLSTLLGSCLNFKGFATSIDLHVFRYEMRMSQRKQHHLVHKAVSTVSRLEALLRSQSASRGD